VRGDSQPESALPAGDPGGDVQQPVAQCLGFAAGELAVEQGGLGPGDQVGGQQGELEPGGVEVELAGREPAQPGDLAGADAVLDPGVRPVPGLQVGQLPDLRVGGECLEPPAVDVGEGQLRPGAAVPGGR